MRLIGQARCKRITIHFQFHGVFNEALHKKCAGAGGCSLEDTIVVGPEPPLVGGAFAGLGGKRGAGFMLLQREVTEFQFHFSTDDVVFQETGFDALIERGTCRATEVFPCLNRHGGVGIAQNVSILPSGWNTCIVGDYRR